MTRLYSGKTTTEAHADLDNLLGGIPAGRSPSKLKTYLENNSVFNVMDYGADNTGATSCSNAVDLAVADMVSNGRGILHFPPGLYSHGRAQSMVNWSNVIVSGAGRGVTTHQPFGTYNSIFTTFPEPGTQSAWATSLHFVATNVTIRRCSFDMRYEVIADQGVATPVLGAGTAYPQAADNQQYPIYGIYVDQLTVEDCGFTRTWFNGIEVYGCNDVMIQRNRFRNTGDKNTYVPGMYSAVEIDAFSHRVHVQDNDAINVGVGFDMNAQHPNGSPDGIVGAQDIYFERNIVWNAKVAGIQLDGDARRVYVRNNSLYQMQRNAIVALYSQAGQNNVGGIHVADIRGNTIDGYNIEEIAGIAAIDVIASDVSIDGNTYVNTITEDGTGALTHFGINARQLTETISTVATDAPGSVMIRGNQGRGAFNNATGVESTAKNTTLSGNRIVDSFGNCIAAFKAHAAGSIEVHNEVTWRTVRGPRTTAVGTGRAAITALSANRTENQDLTLTIDADARVQQFLSAVTNNITISISLIGAGNGDTFKIVRRGLGAGTINVASVKTMPASTAAWCEVTYDPTATPLVSDDGSVGAWVLTGYGVL